MTTLSSSGEMLPGVFQTETQKRRQQIATEQQRPTFLGGVFAAIDSEWISSWVRRSINIHRDPRPVDWRMPIDYNDRNFKLTPELVSQLGKDIPEEYWSEFSNAHSEKQALAIRETLLGVAESRQKLARMGYTGMALQMAAGILDPVAIVATVASEGVAGDAVYGAKLGRLQRLWRGGMVAAATVVPVEAPLVAMDPTRDATDLIYTAAGAFVLGGGITAALGGKKLEKSVRNLRKSIELKDAVDAGLEVTPKGKFYFSEQMDATARRKAADRLIDNLDLPEEEMAALKAMPPEETLWQYQERVPDIIHNGPNLDLTDYPTPKKETGFFGRLRYSMVGRLMRSDVPGVRALGVKLADDALAGTREGSVVRMSASEWVRHEDDVRMARFWRKGSVHYKNWIKRREVPLTRRALGEAEDEFWKEVAHAIRRDPGAWTDDVDVNAMAEFMRSEHKELLALAKRYGVKGFADIPENPNYIMRVHNLMAIREAIAQYKMPNVVRLVKASIMRASPDIEDTMAERIAKGYIRNILNQDSDNYVRKARLFSRDYSEELIQSIREASPNITNEEAEAILNRIKPRDEASNVGPRAKRRLELDETMPAMDMLDDEGNVIGKLSIEDLLENNAADLMSIYTRQILGSSAIAEVHRSLSKGPGDVVESFEAIANRLTNEARELGLDGTRKFKVDLARLETLYRSVMGLKLGGDGLFADVLRTMRAVQYIRVMNQVGAAQIPEIAMVISQSGFSAVVQQIPALGSIFKRARNGELTDELLREIELIWAPGTDRLRNRAIARIEGSSNLIEQTNNRFMHILRRGQRFTNDISGMNLIDGAERRMIYAAGVQKWINIADSGKLPSLKRLRVVGLDQEMAERIIGQINKHAKTVDGWLGKRARRINLDAWDDLEAASRFITSMDKWANRSIQTNDIGNLAMWMTTDLGRTLVQFRTFVSVAWEKQFLFNLRMSDWQAFSGWAGTMLLGSLSYVGQTYVNSLGRPDAQEYRDKRLSVPEIGKAAFQRAGWSSILPMVADTIAPMTGGQAPFQYGRTTLLANDVLFGNPTIDWLNNAPRAVRGVIAPIRGDYQFSRQDLAAMRSVAPFQNMFGVKNVIDAIGADLPRNSTQK